MFVGICVRVYDNCDRRPTARLGVPYGTFMVLPDVRSPVAVVIYMYKHTYKQKVLLYSEFIFNIKATANGNRYVREHL